jgi:hypothetical protein
MRGRGSTLVLPMALTVADLVVDRPCHEGIEYMNRVQEGRFEGGVVWSQNRPRQVQEQVAGL